MRDLTLSRSGTRGRSTAPRAQPFCIRLPFVLEERIGVAKISAKRFLTIDESVRSDLCCGGIHRRRRRDRRRQEFRYAREHDDDLAARFASKTVGGIRRHRLGASGARHAGRTPTACFRSHMSTLEPWRRMFAGRTTTPTKANFKSGMLPPPVHAAPKTARSSADHLTEAALAGGGSRVASAGADQAARFAFSSFEKHSRI